MGFSKPTSRPTIEWMIARGLCASSGEEMVRFAAASCAGSGGRVSGYTGQTAHGTYAVEDVDKFALLHGADHDCSPLRVGREVLAGDDAPRAGPAIRLLVQLVEAVVGRVILKDDNSARVTADDDVVCEYLTVQIGEGRRGDAATSAFAPSGESFSSHGSAQILPRRTLCPAGELEGREGADLAKDVGLDERLELAGLGVGAEEFDALSSAADADLLLLGAAEVADAGGGDGARREERLVVEMHRARGVELGVVLPRSLAVSARVQTEQHVSVERAEGKRARRVESGAKLERLRPPLESHEIRAGHAMSLQEAAEARKAKLAALKKRKQLHDAGTRADQDDGEQSVSLSLGACWTATDATAPAATRRSASATTTQRRERRGNMPAPTRTTPSRSRSRA